MQKKMWMGLAVATAMALTGCSSVELDESAKSGTTQDALAAAQALAAANRSVYFAFDSYVVEPKYATTVEANARVLSADPKAHVVIEGNTDSRGSREYNLALGQKRSEAVKQRIQLLGVSADQIEAVSFGREKPVDLRENEEGWAKNRRADIVYR